MNKGNVDRCESPGVVLATQHARRTAQLYADLDLEDYRFKDIDLTKFRINTCMGRFWWIVTILLSAQTVWGYISDGLVVYTTWRDTRDVGATVAYLLTVIISTTILVCELKEARSIYRSGDVSDTCTNSEAYRYQRLRSYDSYCLFKQIGAHTTCNDTFLSMCYFALKGWVRSVFVTLPQLGITLYMSTALESMPTSGAWVSNNWALGLKILLTGYYILVLLISALAYPCLRCYITAQMGHKDYDLKQLYTFVVDKALNKAIRQKQQEDLKDEQGGLLLKSAVTMHVRPASDPLTDKRGGRGAEARKVVSKPLQLVPTESGRLSVTAGDQEADAPVFQYDHLGGGLQVQACHEYKASPSGIIYVDENS